MTKALITQPDSETALIEEMRTQPPSIERLVKLSNYFLENGLGPQQMLDAVTKMLSATKPQFNQATSKLDPVPDLKWVDKGMWWLYKIHAEFISDAQREEIPQHLIAILKDCDVRFQSMSPKELDAKYGMEVK